MTDERARDRATAGILVRQLSRYVVGTAAWTEERVSMVAEALAAVRAEERERAARVAERLDGLPETYHASVFRHMIADAIRAGGRA